MTVYRLSSTIILTYTTVGCKSVKKTSLPLTLVSSVHLPFLNLIPFPLPEYNVLYRTGDFGRVVNGALVFEGRADTQIKVRGHRVDMTEVDMAVKKVKGVDKVTMICYKPGEVNQVRKT